MLPLGHVRPFGNLRVQATIKSGEWFVSLAEWISAGPCQETVEAGQFGMMQEKDAQPIGQSLGRTRKSCVRHHDGTVCIDKACRCVRLLHGLVADRPGKMQLALDGHAESALLCQNVDALVTG